MDALTAKLGKLSKPQIILTAAGAGIAMAIAYRLADRTLDSVLPKKKVEEEEVLDEPKAHPAPPAEGAKVLSGCYDVKIGDRVVADVAHKNVRAGDVGRVVGLVAGRGSEAGRARVNFEGDRGEYNYMMGQQCHRLPIVDDIVVGDQVIVAATGKRGVIAGGCEGSATKVQVDVDGKTVIVEREDLDHAPLVGKFLTKGDCVRACAPFEHVGVGDRGVVAGPCSSLGLDSFRSRVLVDFGTKGRYNYTRAQLAFESLVGDYAKEDKVVATQPLPGVPVGETGVVIGLARPRGCAALRVDFGPRGTVDADVNSLDHAPLVPGHRIKKGDRIVAKVAYEETEVGDVGVVVGPCDREMHARDLRVCVLWERTKAKNNWQPGRHIELAAEARRMESSAQ